MFRLVISNLILPGTQIHCHIKQAVSDMALEFKKRSPLGFLLLKNKSSLDLWKPKEFPFN